MDNAVGHPFPLEVACTSPANELGLDMVLEGRADAPVGTTTSRFESEVLRRDRGTVVPILTCYQNVTYKRLVSVPEQVDRGPWLLRGPCGRW